MSQALNTPGAARERSSSPLVRTTILVVFLGWTLSYADRQLITIALPFIGTSFDISKAEQGLIVSAFFLAYAVMQIPGGMLTDRFGAKLIATVGLVAWSVFTMISGLMPGLIALLVVRVLFGIGEGVFPSASMRILAERVPRETRMSATGWTLSSNAVGTLAAATLGAVLIARTSWHVAFFVFGVIGLGASALFWRRLPDAPAVSDEATPAVPLSGGRLLRTPAMYSFTAMFFGYGVIVWGLTTWVPSYLYDGLHVPITKASLLMVPVVVLSAAGIVYGGRLADRFNGRTRPIVIPAMIAAIILLVAASQVRSVGLFVLLIGLGAASASVTYMSVYAMPMRNLLPAVSGVGTAIVTVGSQLAGIITPVLMGAVVDHFSFSAAFALLAVGGLISIVATLLAPQTADAFKGRVGDLAIEAIDEPASDVAGGR